MLWARNFYDIHLKKMLTSARSGARMQWCPCICTNTGFSDQLCTSGNLWQILLLVAWFRLFRGGISNKNSMSMFVSLVHFVSVDNIIRTSGIESSHSQEAIKIKLRGGARRLIYKCCEKKSGGGEEIYRKTDKGWHKTFAGFYQWFNNIRLAPLATYYSHRGEPPCAMQ